MPLSVLFVHGENDNMPSRFCSFSCLTRHDAALDMCVMLCALGAAQLMTGEVQQLADRHAYASVDSLQSSIRSAVAPETRVINPKAAQYLPRTSSISKKQSAASNSANASGAPKSDRVCKSPGCNAPVGMRMKYCAAHSTSRRCKQPGCNKCAQGSTLFCISHGGGRRCKIPGCTRAARDMFYCAGQSFTSS